jgi:hypothetical protein
MSGADHPGPVEPVIRSSVAVFLRATRVHERMLAGIPSSCSQLMCSPCYHAAANYDDFDVWDKG